jgi:hypothetical protein
MRNRSKMHHVLYSTTELHHQGDTITQEGRFLQGRRYAYNVIDSKQIGVCNQNKDKK